MKGGFYWGTLLLEVEGERSGVVFVKDGTGYLNGFALKITAYYFGPNPKPISVPEWLVNEKSKANE